MSPSLRLWKVFSFNSQTISNRTFLSKRFFGNNTFSSEWIVKAIKLCPILSSSKLLVSFRHDLVGSPRFSADAHRHQVFSWTVFQAGRVDYTPHQALPFLHCAPNSFGESLMILYVLWSILIICSADPLGELHEIQVSSTSCGSLWCEDRFDTWEGISSLSLGEETTFTVIILT